LFQACRGERLDPGITLRKEIKTEVDSSTASYKIPKHADFLITFSTYDGKFQHLEYHVYIKFVQYLMITFFKVIIHSDILRMAHGLFRVFVPK